MTEEEAKAKWCPVAKHLCVGRNCMMWRWNNASPEVRDQARAVGFEPMLESIGYCGLGGKP